VDHQRAFERHARKRLRHEFGGRQVKGAHDLERGFRRIAQGTEYVEYRAHAQRRAHRRDGSHRRMVMRRKQESEPRCREAIAGALLVQRDLDPQALQHIGAARAAGHGSIAMLDHGEAAGRRKQGRACRQVEATGSVPAGTDDVDRLQPRRQARPTRQRPHARRKAPQFRSRYPFGAQCAQQRTGHGRCHVGRGEGGQQFTGIAFREILPIQQAIENVVQ
jgi:hypothetical protein